MNDIKLFLNDTVDEGITPRIENGDFVSDEGLETAVLLSLFTDARVPAEQLPQGETFRRGWWGDKVSDVDQDVIGSRLWLLRREKRTTIVLRKFEDYTTEALMWMVEDGVAESIKSKASYHPTTKFLILEIEIKRPRGVTRFNVNWDKQLFIRS